MSAIGSCKYGGIPGERAMPPSLSFRGAKRRGNLLQPVAFSPGVTCYPTGSCEIATAPSGPRNDKSGGIAPMSLCRNHCQPAWRSLTAATDAIGAHRFAEALYESQPLRREGHAPPLQGVCGRRSTQKIAAAHGASRTPPPTRRRCPLAQKIRGPYGPRRRFILPCRPVRAAFFSAGRKTGHTR